MNADQNMKLFLAIRQTIEDNIDSPDGLPFDDLLAVLAMVTAQMIRTARPSDDEAAMRLVKMFGKYLAVLIPVAPVFHGAEVVHIKRHEND